jgi:PAS domain S-box-containing protein
MVVEDSRGRLGTFWAGSGASGEWLRSHDWSQTPLGAIETWSDDLKAAVQIVLTELDQAQPKDAGQTTGLNAFRGTLAHALRPLTAATEIQATAARLLGETLGANRVVYIEVMAGGEEVIVHGNYINGVAPLNGRFRLADYSRNLTADHWAGRSQVVADISHYPGYGQAEQQRYQEVDIAAYIDVPLIKDQQFVALLAVHQATPRQWTTAEVTLVEETLAQTWAAVERASAEAALRASEKRYRSLFQSIDDGFFIAEVLVDGHDRPMDYRFLETNSVFSQQTSLHQVVGQTVRQLVPDVEDFWIETLGNVALTGVPIRFENYAAGLDRWFDVYAYRAGRPEERQVAVLFKNISDRKRHEGNLVFLSEMGKAMAPLSTTGEIMQAVGEKLADFLKIQRCHFLQIDAAGDEIRYLDRWATPGLTPLPETLSLSAPAGLPLRDLLRQQTAVLSHDTTGAAPQTVEALIAVPLQRPDKETYGFSVMSTVPRQWRKDEIELVGEVANRLFLRLERAQADAALRESEHRLQTALSIQSVGVLFFTLDGRITEANDAFLRMSGYSHDELLNLTDWQVLTPPEFWPITVSAVADLATHGETPPYEKQHIRRDGSRWWGLFSPTRLKGCGAQAECVEFIVDISDRKQAEALLIDDLDNTRLLRNLSARLISEDNIQVLYDEIMAAAIALTQADGGTLQILDPGTGDLVLLASLGVSPSLVDQFRRVPAGPPPFYGDALLQETRTLVDLTGETTSADPSVSLQIPIAAGYGAAQSTPLICRSGRVIGVVATYWWQRHSSTEQELSFLDLLARQAADLIEQRQAKAERDQILAREQTVRAQAETANRTKDEFLAVLSHELRSPLNPILGWTQLLRQGRLSAERQREALATIERNAKLQTQLINDLLDISRIVQGKLNLAIQPVDLRQVIAAALDTVRLTAATKSLQIHTQLDPSVGSIMGDPGRLQQVLWNLLSNAVKFTPPGGQVTIVLTPARTGTQIQVIDTGKGIDPGFLPRVFDHFRQEDATTTRRFGGLGLGLAIARQIVEMHGGEIGVESPGENQGTTFTVLLPLPSSPLPVPAATPAIELIADLRGLHILVVDDEIDSREVVAVVLEQAGATVTRVGSGIAALAAIDRCPPDLIVSDIGMPDMDGYRLIQRIRHLEQAKAIPAIALTAYAGEQNRQRAIAAGFDGHRAKPIEPVGMSRLVAQLCGRSGE